MASLFGRGFDSLQVHDDYFKPLNISGFCFFLALILFPFYQSAPSEKLYKNLKLYSDRAVLYYCPMQ